MALGLWGGKYKKEEGFKSTGKAQEPVYKRSGKEEIDAMFSSIQSCFPPASFPDEGELPADIAKVFDSVWLYGFDVQMASVAQTPNGVAIFKYLAAGEVEYLLFELKTFVPAVKTILEKDAVSVDEAIAFINNLTTEKMKQFCEKGGAMQRAVLSATLSQSVLRKVSCSTDCGSAATMRSSSAFTQQPTAGPPRCWRCLMLSSLRHECMLGYNSGRRASR